MWSFWAQAWWEHQAWMPFWGLEGLMEDVFEPLGLYAAAEF